MAEDPSLLPEVINQCPWQPGDRLWLREPFSTRLDGDRIKIRYPADGPQGEARFVATDRVPSKYRTGKYTTRPAKYMPRWACRTVLVIVETGLDRTASPTGRLTIRFELAD